MPAVLTRVGVFTYQDSNGETWGELRPAEEVFAPESLATLRDAPVTEGHPPALVTRETWDDVAIGHNGGVAAPEGDRFVVTDGLVVQSAPAVAKILSGELCETSCGYTCDLEESPGVYDGLPYTRVQRGIRYNHVALGREGWARGGADMALRMDGAAVEVGPPSLVPPLPTTPSAASAATARNDAAGAPAKDPPMKILKIKGRTFRLDDEAEMAEAQKTADAQGEEVTSQASANASVSAELAATKMALVELAQKLSALEVKIAAEEASDQTPAAVTEDMVPEAIQDSIVAKRGALLVTARALLPKETKLDGLKAGEIKKLVVARAHPTVKLDGLGNDTIDGMYLATTAKAAEQDARRDDGQNALSRVLTPGAEQSGNVAREDGEPENPSVVLQRKLEERGKAPLTTKQAS